MARPVRRVAILDADKEGFLRSSGSLIQTMGRAARHVEGHAILYADVMTDSMRRALEETALTPEQRVRFIGELEERMREAARKFEFEKAAQLRDRVKPLKAVAG